MLADLGGARFSIYLMFIVENMNFEAVFLGKYRNKSFYTTFIPHASQQYFKIFFKCFLAWTSEG